MRYFKVDDFYYFTDDGLNELKEKYKIDNIIKVVSREQILNEMMNSKNIESLNFISCFLPKDVLPDFDGLELIRIPNKYGLLTREQKERNVSAFEILKTKIGANIYQPKVTFDDYVIDKDSVEFKNLMTQIRMIDVKKETGLPLKGFFLTGVPGTGKTFFAKCVAGELNRVLIHLNLSIFINATDTFGLLESFFGFFEYNEGKYVVLIDEIEKMLSGNNPKTKQVLGWLLTALNDINEKSLKSEVFFIATANNITALASENPELFRKGRFDMSIYLSAPNLSKTHQTFEIYIDKMNKIFENKILPFLTKTAYEKIKFNKVLLIKPNSRASHIIDYFSNNASFLEAINNDMNFYEILEKNEIKEIFSNLKIEYRFNINVEKMVAIINAIYRDELVDRELFAYVPAEIEQMLGELFSMYFFDDEEADLTAYFRKNIPIQIAMRQGIIIMNEATQNFIRF